MVSCYTPVFCGPLLVFICFQQKNTQRTIPIAVSTEIVAMNNMAATTATTVSLRILDTSPTRSILGEADGDVLLEAIPVMKVVVVATVMEEVGRGSLVTDHTVVLETALLGVPALGEVAGSEEL